MNCCSKCTDPLSISSAMGQIPLKHSGDVSSCMQQDTLPDRRMDHIYNPLTISSSMHSNPKQTVTEIALNPAHNFLAFLVCSISNWIQQHRDMYTDVGCPLGRPLSAIWINCNKTPYSLQSLKLLAKSLKYGQCGNIYVRLLIELGFFCGTY